MDDDEAGTDDAATMVALYRDDDGHVQVGLRQDFVDARERVKLYVLPLMWQAEMIKNDTDIVLRTLEQSDTIAPMFDPTGWMRTRETARIYRTMARALQTCIRELEPVIAKMKELEARGEGADAGISGTGSGEGDDERGA